MLARPESSAAIAILSHHVQVKAATGWLVGVAIKRGQQKPKKKKRTSKLINAIYAGIPPKNHQHASLLHRY